MTSFLKEHQVPVSGVRELPALAERLLGPGWEITTHPCGALNDVLDDVHAAAEAMRSQPNCKLGGFHIMGSDCKSHYRIYLEFDHA